MKLEPGKRYIRRDGIVTWDLLPTGDDFWKFRDPKTGVTYTGDGLSAVCGQSPEDLIAEYGEPEPSRRYDLAKDCLLAIIARGDGFLAPLEASHLAITYADLLIEKLEETK